VVFCRLSLSVPHVSMYGFKSEDLNLWDMSELCFARFSRCIHSHKLKFDWYDGL